MSPRAQLVILNVFQKFTVATVCFADVDVTPVQDKCPQTPAKVNQIFLKYREITNGNDCDMRKGCKP